MLRRRVELHNQVHARVFWPSAVASQIERSTLAKITNSKTVTTVTPAAHPLSHTQTYFLLKKRLPNKKSSSQVASTIDPPTLLRLARTRNRQPIRHQLCVTETSSTKQRSSGKHDDVGEVLRSIEVSNNTMGFNYMTQLKARCWQWANAFNDTL